MYKIGDIISIDFKRYTVIDVYKDMYILEDEDKVKYRYTVKDSYKYLEQI